MARNGWKCLKRARHGEKSVEWFKRTGNFWKLLETYGNIFILQEMSGHCLKYGK